MRVGKLCAGRVAAAFGMMMAMGVGVLRADDWEAYQHDAQHTGLSSSGLDPMTLNYSWSAPSRFTDPLIVGNSVYAIATQQLFDSPVQIESFNMANGAMNWSFSATYDTSASVMAYGNGTLFYLAETSDQFNRLHTQLYTLNALTGQPGYSVPIPNVGGFITLAPDVATSQQIAYIADEDGIVSAVRLGATSGTVLWSHQQIGSGGPPSIAGNLLLVASTDHYYAIDRTTGAVNTFHSGNLIGPGVPSPVVDAGRKEFYILDSGTLWAYSYASGGITALWHQSGMGLASPGSASGEVALAPNGDIISADRSTITERDPATGNIVHSAPGAFAAFNTTVVSRGYVYDFGADNLQDPRVSVYRVGDLGPVTTLSGSPNSNHPPFTGSGALDDTHFILDNGGAGLPPGFDVYSGLAPIAGDANRDGDVDFADLLTLAQHYGQSGASWSTGDFNYDGKVDFSDLLLLAQNYSVVSPGAGLAARAVPEPAHAALAATLLVGACLRRRTRPR